MGRAAAFPPPTTTRVVRAGGGRGGGVLEILLPPRGGTDAPAVRARLPVVVAFRGCVGWTHARAARIQIAERTRIGPEELPAQSPAERVGRDTAQELQSQEGGEGVPPDGG